MHENPTLCPSFAQALKQIGDLNASFRRGMEDMPVTAQDQVKEAEKQLDKGTASMFEGKVGVGLQMNEGLLRQQFFQTLIDELRNRFSGLKAVKDKCCKALVMEQCWEIALKEAQEVEQSDEGPKDAAAAAAVKKAEEKK